MAIFKRFYNYVHNVQAVQLSTFLNHVQRGEVSRADVHGDYVTGQLLDGTRFEVVIHDAVYVAAVLQQHGVPFAIVRPSGIKWAKVRSILWLIFACVALVVIVRKGMGGVFEMSKSKAKMYLPAEIKDRFSSVAGAAEAKEELKDVVDFLRDPKKYERLGAKITRGVLLVGEPGNGKTLLARAVAGEANCPFFSVAGSDFIEALVGVGAARVRDVFKQAREHAPSIIFIDEIDAIGRQRGHGLSGGHEEREQTLNQLLTEMDGFDTTKDKPVIVMAATNIPDVLDKALLRPGRFDRRVEVPFPDLKSRQEILAVHAQPIQMAPDIDLGVIARGTPGFSGADLANLLNEAAIIAAKKNADMVTLADIEAARDKVLLGKESSTMMLTEKDKWETAVHESGHALVTLLSPESTDPLYKLTIIPRGRTLGVTHSMPEREKYNSTKKEMLTRINVALGGRIAEELFFDGLMSTGASSDFKTATSIARDMVCKYGMTDDIGVMVCDYDAQGKPYFSQETAAAVDESVRGILRDCHKQTTELLNKNRDKLEKLAQELMKRETLYASEVYELLGITPREDFKLTK